MPPPSQRNRLASSRLFAQVRDLLAIEAFGGLSHLPIRQPPRAAGDRAARLQQLEQQAERCTRCSLHRTRTHLVFGEGHPRARLVFVGEAPGRDEDLQGRPFVGQAGQLLTRIIEAMGLRREEVYICNVLKDRPPGNRAPLPEEVAACRGWLEEQLRIMQPKAICALGRHATQTLLQTARPIGELRGRWHAWEGIPLMPTLHPAYLLRNPSAKRLVWEDMKQVRARLDER